MLIKHISACLAMTAGVLTTIVNGPEGVTDYSYVGPLIDDSTGFSKDQIDQVQQANSDAVRFCQTAVEAKGTETFNHVFQRYFHIDDRDFVVTRALLTPLVNVLNQVLNAKIYDYESPGNPRPLFEPNLDLRGITVVADFPFGPDMRTACDSGKDYAQLRDSTEPKARLVVCPDAFKHAGAFPVDGHITWPGVEQLTCKNVGEHVSWKMLSMATVFVQKYTYYKQIMGDALKDYGGQATDVARGPFDVLHLEREKAKKNGDSYAWFVTELAWTLHCGRTFSDWKVAPGSKS